MVELLFTGDTSELNEKQKEFISNIVRERGFVTGEIKIETLGKVDDNFVAKVKRVTVKSENKTLNMIVKVAPKNEIQRHMMNVDVLFGNEHVMYTEVLPKFTGLQKAANVPKEERLRYAACYGTYMEAPNELILLEDLAVSGFSMLDKSISMTDETVKLVLKNFAILHSMSYALKYKEPEVFDKFCKSLVDFRAVMAENPQTKMWAHLVDADIQVLLDDDKYKSVVKDAISNAFSLGIELTKQDAISKYSVIQQGDGWINNFMFRFQDDRAVECYIIDYQASKQSSPAADLHYMILNCTDHNTRLKHYHDWINYYHSQMDQHLSHFGLKVNYVYPRDRLDVDLRRFGKLSLGYSIMIAMTVIMESADAKNVKKSLDSATEGTSFEEIGKHIKLSQAHPEILGKFKTKLKGIVDSLIEFGCL